VNPLVQPTADEVIAGARTTLQRYQGIARYIEDDAIAGSVNGDWPSLPRPTLYLLYMASAQGLGGQQEAPAHLDRIEQIIGWPDSGVGVTGSWEARIKEITTLTRHTDRDRYTAYQSALFEFITAGQLTRPEVTIKFLPNGGPPSCDLGITLIGDLEPFVAVEAYAPHKGIEAWYEQHVAEPWRKLVNGEQAESTHTAVLKYPADALGVIATALSNMLTSSNFEDKIRQLASGNAPTLLAVRLDMLVERTYQLFVPTGLALADRITTEAWAKLPQKCQGMLLVTLTDRPVFIPAPGRTVGEALHEYLQMVAS
jgi:hypothetical protein